MSFFYHQSIRNLDNKESQTNQEIEKSIFRFKFNLITFPLDTPKAYKNNIVKISMKPERPVPEPKVIIRSEGSAFR
jgi:hypothetical protein